MSHTTDQWQRSVVHAFCLGLGFGKLAKARDARHAGQRGTGQGGNVILECRRIGGIGVRLLARRQRCGDLEQIPPLFIWFVSLVTSEGCCALRGTLVGLKGALLVSGKFGMGPRLALSGAERACCKFGYGGSRRKYRMAKGRELQGRPYH